MKKYSLEFIDSVAEEQFQAEKNKEKIGLISLFLVIKVALSLVQIATNTSINNFSNESKQGIMSLGIVSFFLLILHFRCIKVSVLLNLIQLTIPIATLLTDQYWNNMFIYGGYKTINMVTLLIFGTNYLSNCLCFIFATVIYAYDQQFDSVNFYVINYSVSILWFIVLKYLSDRDRRQTFLFKTKDQQWTHIMKEMIDDWVVMVTYSSKNDQIVVRDANQNFKRSCNISDDIIFRKFVRSIRVQTDTIGDRNDSFSYIIQRDNFSKNQTIQDLEFKINQNPDFEQVLRENLIKQEEKSFLWNQKEGNIKVKRFTGVQFDGFRRKFSLYSIRLIKGSDTEPFILLTIKELKHLKITDYLSNQELVQKNLFKMSTLCGQYFRITQRIFNQFQQKKLITIFHSHSKMPKIMSQLLTISNMHYVQQLYLNQVYNMKDFKFESPVSCFRIDQIMNMLISHKKNQIRIVLIGLDISMKEVTTFQRELLHLFLIFIENTIKHSKLTKPKIFIKCEESSKEIIKFTITDYGQGISIQLSKQLLDSYRVSVSREKKIQILDSHQYTIHIRQQMKYGWVVARLLLSLLSPDNGFCITSMEQQGCCISFSIYRNISNVVSTRTFDLIHLVEKNSMII